MAIRKVSKNNRAFKGVWIPAKYWLDPDLTMIEVNTIAEIDSLDNEDGCFASNKHFSDFLGVTTGRVSQIINGLKEKGYITIDYDKKGKQIIKRRIRVVNKLNTPLVNKLNRGIKNIKGGYLENCKDSNTSKSNTNNSNTNSASHSNAQPDTLAQQRREVIEYLNKKTDSKFKPNAKGNKSVIDPRLKEGYTVDDMKMIIDAMYSKWHGNKFSNGSMGDDYLRPETLFRVSKIEGYLNIARKMKKQQKPDDMFDMGGWIRE